MSLYGVHHSEKPEAAPIPRPAYNLFFVGGHFHFTRVCYLIAFTRSSAHRHPRRFLNDPPGARGSSLKKGNLLDKSYWLTPLSILF